MAQIKGNRVNFSKTIPDTMTTEESNTLARKKALQDKTNRAPQYNKGISKGKRDIDYSTEI
jgi:hypothetical protein